MMFASYKGYLSIVYGLHGCPHLDINHQDNDGNTALMIAAQAGQLSVMIIKGAAVCVTTYC